MGGRRKADKGVEEQSWLLPGGGGGAVALRRLWNTQSSRICSCLGSHIKAPESVNRNELPRSSCCGTLSPVTVLFQPIDLFSQ